MLDAGVTPDVWRRERDDRPVTRRTTKVLRVAVDSVETSELLRAVDRFIQHGRPHQICYVNGECLNQAFFDRRYREILREADLVYADGMGVVWASRLFGEPLPERITLGDCLPRLCELCRQRGYRLFFLGGPPGVAAQAAERLTQRFPGLQIVGAEQGYLPAAEDQAVIERINRARPHLLLAGLGVPKQEKWLWRHRRELQVPILWGVGALFEYYAGVTPRAPRWLRRIGFEWFFRLVVEPKRLWRRYLLGNAFFVLRACALLVIDAALVTVAWLGAYGICRRLGQPLGLNINVVDPYLTAVPLITGIWLVTCAGFGLYRRSAAMSGFAELAQVIRATWVGLLSTMAVAFLLREFSFGRPVVVLAAALTFVLLTASRMVTRAIESRLASQGIGLRRVLIVGTGPLARRLKEEIEIWPIGYEVVGFVSDGEAACEIPHAEIVGSIQDLGQLIRQRHVQDVFVARQGLKLHQELNLLASQEHWSVDFHVLSQELEPVARRLPLGRVVELPLLDLPHARSSAWYDWTKRVCDVLVGGVGLLLCLPLCAVIAFVIRVESPGPAVFVQERVGKGGKPFRMSKFRTMAAGSAAYEVAPNDLDDPRVTRFGRFLRRWSLDEFPQLVNVLKGEMSLVGPRPEMPFLVKQYEPWQRRRLAVRPGLTGLWQVVGRKEMPLDRNIEYDLYYVRHRGWILDSVILLRTLPAVLSRRGAF